MDTSEDYCVMVPLCFYANKIEYIPNSFYHYIQYNSSSISKRKVTGKEINAWLHSVSQLEDFIKANHLLDYHIERSYRKIVVRSWCMERTYGEERERYANLYPEVHNIKLALLQIMQGKGGTIIE